MACGRQGDRFGAVDREKHLMLAWWKTRRGILCVLAITLCFAPAAFAQTAEAPDLSGIKIDGDYGPHLPPVVYAHDYGRSADMLINLLHYFMAALFVGWGIFFVYCLFRFRARPGHQASSSQVKASVSKYLEIGVAIFEAVLLIGLSVPVWASVKNDLPTEAENPVRLRVTGEQFAWNFHYPGPDGVFGKTAPKFLDLATNPMGVDPADENGKDDIVSLEMHIPIDRPIVAEIGSKDVIHSFFVPVLRVKQDAIPGMRIPVWFQAAKTGRYEVACAQLCGNNHYSMRAIMVVDDEAAFNEWYAEKSKPPEVFDEDEF
jgi:cytochrome c oxidase subunit 2